MSEFKLFMTEQREVNRWFVAKVFITGAFVGGLATALFMISGFVV